MTDQEGLVLGRGKRKVIKREENGAGSLCLTERKSKDAEGRTQSPVDQPEGGIDVLGQGKEYTQINYIA